MEDARKVLTAMETKHTPEMQWGKRVRQRDHTTLIGRMGDVSRRLALQFDNEEAAEMSEQLLADANLLNVRKCFLDGLKAEPASQVLVAFDKAGLQMLATIPIAVRQDLLAQTCYALMDKATPENWHLVLKIARCAKVEDSEPGTDAAKKQSAVPFSTGIMLQPPVHSNALAMIWQVQRTMLSSYIERVCKQVEPSVFTKLVNDGLQSVGLHEKAASQHNYRLQDVGALDSDGFSHQAHVDLEALRVFAQVGRWETL